MMTKGQSKADEVKETELRSTGEDGEEARLRDPEVNYMGPKLGPFMCGHCKYFEERKDGRGYCSHPEVRAHVESAGCCNEYTSEEAS